MPLNSSSSALSTSTAYQSDLTGLISYSGCGTKGVLAQTSQHIFRSQALLFRSRVSLTLSYVVDIHHPNHFIKLLRFCMLMFTEVSLALHPCAFFVTLDKQNAYWHIPIDPRCQCFLVIPGKGGSSSIHNLPVLPNHSAEGTL